VARTFRADARLFGPAAERDAAATAVSSMVSTVLESTASELGALLARNGGGATLEDQGVLTFLEARANETEIRRLRTRSVRLIESETGRASERGASTTARRYRLTLAFFPLDDETRPRRRR